MIQMFQNAAIAAGRSVRKTCALAATITAFMAVTVTPAAAAILIVDGNGQLTGATGVDVGGTLFDVTFVEGTCAALFDGCDETSDFDFTDQATAEAAGQALFDQVFIDGLTGNFDTDADSTFGCENVIFCNVLLPFLILSDSFGAVEAINSDFELFEEIRTFQSLFPNNFDTEIFGNFVFASFTEQSVSAVPLPAAAWMFLAGLSGLGVARRRSKNSKEL